MRCDGHSGIATLEGWLLGAEEYPQLALKTIRDTAWTWHKTIPKTAFVRRIFGQLRPLSLQSPQSNGSDLSQRPHIIFRIAVVGSRRTLRRGLTSAVTGANFRNASPISRFNSEIGLVVSGK